MASSIWADKTKYTLATRRNSASPLIRRRLLAFLFFPFFWSFRLYPLWRYPTSFSITWPWVKKKKVESDNVPVGGDMVWPVQFGMRLLCSPWHVEILLEGDKDKRGDPEREREREKQGLIFCFFSSFSTPWSRESYEGGFLFFQIPCSALHIYSRAQVAHANVI